jgi:nitric oxide reductase NorQ protein
MSTTGNRRPGGDPPRPPRGRQGSCGPGPQGAAPALAGLPETAALRQARAASVPALLYGPPGTGQAALAEAAFPDLITFTGDIDATTADLAGEYTENPGGGATFAPGPLARAMAGGRALIISDAGLLPPDVLAVAVDAMNAGAVAVPGNGQGGGGEIFTAAPGFCVIAGHSTRPGMTLPATLDGRFRARIPVPGDYDLAAYLGIDARVVGAARELDQMRQEGRTGWAPQLRELLAYSKIAGILGEPAAVANLAGIAPPEDRAAVAAALAAAFGLAAVAPFALGCHRPGRRG